MTRDVIGTASNRPSSICLSRGTASPRWAMMKATAPLSFVLPVAVSSCLTISFHGVFLAKCSSSQSSIASWYTSATPPRVISQTPQMLEKLRAYSLA